MRYRLMCLLGMILLFTVSGTIFAQEPEPIPVGQPDGIVLNHDGSQLLTWFSEGKVTVFDSSTGSELLTLEHDQIVGASWNADASRILSWSDEGIHVWNSENGSQLLTFNLEGGVAGAAWNYSGTEVLVWNSTAIVLLNAQTGDEETKIETDEGITGASLSLDSTSILWWTESDNAYVSAISATEIIATDSPGTDEPTSTSASTAAELTQGKWQMAWGERVTTCPDEYQVSASDRPFILMVDQANDTFTTEDIFVWSLFSFLYSRDANGNYVYLRNEETSTGGTFSIEYKATVISSDRIEGVATDYFEGVNCVTSIDFVMTLIDEQIVCIAGSAQGANFRSGPGTSYSRPGTLVAGVPEDVTGQAVGDDGFVWWKLGDKGWVREDVIQAVGICDAVPTVTP